MYIETVIIAFVMLLLAVAGMAVGVIFTGRRLKGSCGGLSAIPGADRCDLCGRDLQEVADSGCAEQGPTARDA